MAENALSVMMNDDNPGFIEGLPIQPLMIAEISLSY
jgi:hypothetical protein